MKTDNGSHPPEYWAEVTANEMVEVEGKHEEGLALKAEIQKVLETAYVMILADEKAGMEGDSTKLFDPIIPSDLVLADIVEQIVTAGTAKGWGDHFQSPRVQSYLRRVLKQHLVNAKDIERRWFADRNPNKPDVKTYKEFRARRGPMNVHLEAERSRR